MNSDGGIAIAIGYAVAGAFFGLAYWIWRKETAARKWPRTAGVILASQCLKGPKSSVPVIEYEFAYQGQSFKSSHWRLGNYSTGTAGFSTDAEAVARRYPVHRPVTVFVNPQDPTKSVLETKGSLFWLPLSAGVFIFILSTAIVITAALQGR
ncbi:MAG TPA: DUF3592 domain-containing protein [Candidatus Sulfotelmatobacter sp.]|nr:DUF3592 domain-containing protein [Candidatus Sulfotelmatobacter sp.]